MRTFEIVSTFVVSLYILFRGWVAIVEWLAGRRVWTPNAGFTPFIAINKAAAMVRSKEMIKSVIALTACLAIIFCLMARNHISL